MFMSQVTNEDDFTLSLKIIYMHVQDAFIYFSQLLQFYSFINFDFQ